MKLNELTKEQKLTYVGLLTELQKDEVWGQWYAPDSYMYPIQDINAKSNNLITIAKPMPQYLNLFL